MRRAKRERRLAPFWAGMAGGYIAALVVAVIGAAIVLSTDSAESLSGAMSIAALAAGSFFSGRISGGMRRRDGLKTGALCAVMYLLPLVILSLLFGVMSGALLPVKCLLCVAFGAAGGVVGVNHSDS